MSGSATLATNISLSSTAPTHLNVMVAKLVGLQMASYGFIVMTADPYGLKKPAWVEIIPPLLTFVGV
jgi:hypothetical protein